MKKIIDLGWENGWHGTPDVSRKLRRKDLKSKRSDTTADSV